MDRLFLALTGRVLRIRSTYCVVGRHMIPLSRICDLPCAYVVPIQYCMPTYCEDLASCTFTFNDEPLSEILVTSQPRRVVKIIWALSPKVCFVMQGYYVVTSAIDQFVPAHCRSGASHIASYIWNSLHNDYARSCILLQRLSVQRRR